MTWFRQLLYATNRAKMLVDESEENEENIEKVNKSFISMKGNLSVLKKIKKKKLLKNSFKWTDVLNAILLRKFRDFEKF